jgi:pimeloyl-ACP methyl ester carboxylesterase
VPSLNEPARGRHAGWRHGVEAVSNAVRELADPIVLVGHSGGGLLLPAIADTAVPPVRRLIFVDSGLPARTGQTPIVPGFFLDHLRTLAVDEMMPPWSDWFGDDTMRELIPDEALRASLAREMPSLPLAFFEQQVPSPEGWDQRPCGYLLLSEAYRDAAAEARERGWPVQELAAGHHLHIVVAPKETTDAILRLAGA